MAKKKGPRVSTATFDTQLKALTTLSPTLADQVKTYRRSFHAYRDALAAERAEMSKLRQALVAAEAKAQRSATSRDSYQRAYQTECEASRRATQALQNIETRAEAVEASNEYLRKMVQTISAQASADDETINALVRQRDQAENDAKAYQRSYYAERQNADEFRTAFNRVCYEKSALAAVADKAQRDLAEAESKLQGATRALGQAERARADQNEDIQALVLAINFLTSKGQ